MKTVEKFVEIRSGANTLRGMIHLPRATKKVPGVLLLHGFTGQKAGSHFIHVKNARALAARGVAAMRFDFAGSGESDGRFQDMSVLTELEDAKAALSYIARARGVDPRRLGVVGHSLGGCVAGMLLEDPRLSAGVLWAAVADLGPLSERTAPPSARRQLARKGFVELGAHKIGRRFIDDALKADPVSAVGRSAADILVLHGDNDEAVPLEHARMFLETGRKRSNGTKTKLVVLKGYDHTFESVRQEQTVIRRTVEWLVTHLYGRGGRKALAGKVKRGK